MPERRAGVEKASFGRVVFFLTVEIGTRRAMFFYKLAGRFFNGAESGTAQGRCGGVCGAVRFLPVFSCGALLLFILVLEIFVWN